MPQIDKIYFFSQTLGCFIFIMFLYGIVVASSGLIFASNIKIRINLALDNKALVLISAFIDLFWQLKLYVCCGICALLLIVKPLILFMVCNSL